MAFDQPRTGRDFVEGPPLAEQINREPEESQPTPEYPLDRDQLLRLEGIAALMMAPVLEQCDKSLQLELEQAAFLSVELAFHIMNKARDCRLIEGKIGWRSVDA